MPVVKVQRPVSRSDDAPDVWCVYAEGRTNLQLIPAESVPASVKTALGADFKGYFNATWQGSENGWSIEDRCEPKPW